MVGWQKVPIDEENEKYHTGGESSVLWPDKKQREGHIKYKSIQHETQTDTRRTEGSKTMEEKQGQEPEQLLITPPECCSPRRYEWQDRYVQVPETSPKV